jgi:tetratricopeptide (TPR) repeat protein
MNFRALSLIFILLSSSLQAAWGQSLTPQYEAHALSAGRAFAIISFLDQSPKPKTLDSTAAVLQSLIAKEPGNPFYPLTLGKVYRLKGDLEAADSAYARASRAAGGELILHGMLGLAFERERLPLLADQEFREVRSAMIERGISSVPALSLALVEQGQTFLKRGDATTAELDFRRAIEFAPPLLAAHLSLVQLAPKGRLRETAVILIQGARPLFYNFENQLLLTTNAYLILLGVALALSLGILTALIIAYLTSLHHFLIERLPAFFPRPARFLLVTSLILALLFARLPVSLFLLLGTAGVWVWLSKPERRLALFAMGILVLAPFLLMLGAVLFAPLDAQNPALILSRAQEIEPDILTVSRVRTMIARDPQDPDLFLTAGLLAKRGGKLDEAREDYQRHLTLSPNSFRGQVNFGNIFFRQGNYDSAQVLYQKAVDLEPLSAAAHFNLSQAYLKKLDFQGAETEYHNAARLDFRLTDRISSRPGRDSDSLGVVADETLPLRNIWDHVARGYHFETLPGVLLRELFGIELFLNPYVSVLILFAMLFLRIAGREVKPAEHCHTCGRPLCAQCRPPESPDLCPRCARKIEGTASPEMKETVLSAIATRRSRFFLLRNAILSFILPGSGHVYLGRLGKGVFFLLGASVLFVFYRLRGRLIPPIPTLTQETLASWLPLWWAAFALFYVLLIFSLRKLHLPPEEASHGA